MHNQLPPWYQPPSNQATGGVCSVGVANTAPAQLGPTWGYDPYNNTHACTFPMTTTTAGTSQYYPFTPTTTDWGTVLSNLNQGLAGMIPAGNQFIVLRGDFLVSAHGKARPLLDWLNECKHVRYIKANEEVAILRTVWDSIFVFMNGDGPYADLELPEFLDRIFAPVKPETCAAPQHG